MRLVIVVMRVFVLSDVSRHAAEPLQEFWSEIPKGFNAM